MKIYKYLSQDSALITLTKKSVLLRSPTEYNDPFDCLFYVNKRERDEAYKLFINYQLFRRLYEMFFVDKIKSFRYPAYANALKLNVEQTVETLTKSRCYKFQFVIKMYQTLITKMTNNTFPDLRPEFEAMVKKVTAEFRKTAIVSCFSLDNKSILMWSHYGEKHQGACIEYEVPDDGTFKRVIYSKKLPVFKLKKVMEYVLGHDFFGEKPDTNEKLFQYVFEPLTTKSLEWEYEKEVRCVFSKNERNKSIRFNGQEFLLQMPKPTKIYLGAKAPHDFLAKVKGVAEDIPIIRLEITPGIFEVS